MNPPPFRSPQGFLAYLEDPVAACLWLGGLGIRDTSQALRDLKDLAKGRPPEVVTALANHLDSLLPRCPDAGMALTNLERFIASAPEPAELMRSLATSPRLAEISIQLFSTSQYFSELLIREPFLLERLRAETERRDRRDVLEGMWEELQGIAGEQEQRQALRAIRRREILRIGYNDIIRDHPLELTTLDLSNLADACVECGYRLARRNAEARHGRPITASGNVARFTVLALGKLGGRELNYSSDIDLIFLFDEDGQTDGRRQVTNAEHFARLGGEIVRILSDHTSLGIAYRVDMRLRPEGDQGPLARSFRSTLGYYETAGRTWERQALIKCRAIAGDAALGADFLESIASFVYRRYLSSAEIGEIKAMKRRIELRTDKAGTAELEVKTGRGGIRDVEFVVQFLQLLHGGGSPEVRHPGTLLALARLESIGCLTSEERGIMEETYRFLRRVEHRLQTMFDLQTHEMPRDSEELRKLAVRLGYSPLTYWEDRTGPVDRFLVDYRAKTELNRRILNHLLHDAFRNDDEGGTPADPVVDLVLDPSPSAETIRGTLEVYPFRDLDTAYQNLVALSREDSPFLSQPRCRHFLAAIAPELLKAVSRTPDPDMALTNLEKVSASLGAKAILWELFSFNPPSLRLYVDLCSTSQFLSEILINNPGMIDDLMDSLVVDRSQTMSEIKADLAEVCKGAEDIAPILSSWRNKEWVRIGTRDILGREQVRDVTRELSDVAEAIVVQVAKDVWINRPGREGTPKADWAIVALGKLGGRELNYHGDLDLVFLYEPHESVDDPTERFRVENAVTEVVRRVLRTLEENSGLGRLYSVDTRLRPHGASGSLATPLSRFEEYFAREAQLWERLALTRARVIHGTRGFGTRVNQAIRGTFHGVFDRTRIAPEAERMRKLQSDGSPTVDIKRGEGGLADVEFLVQTLQLVWVGSKLDVSRPNTWDALDALKRAKIIRKTTHARLVEAYDFLKTVEGRLRIVQNRSGSEWPESLEETARLARRLNREGTDEEVAAGLRADLEARMRLVREEFRAVLSECR